MVIVVPVCLKEDLGCSLCRDIEPWLDSVQAGLSFWQGTVLFERGKGDVHLDSLHGFNEMMWLLFLAGS